MPFQLQRETAVHLKRTRYPWRPRADVGGYLQVQGPDHGQMPAVPSLLMPVEDSLETLVTRAQRGDRRAFDAIVRQCLHSAYLIAIAILGRPSDAEDVAQDALIKALERIDTCREPKLFRSWMFQIVRNHARNWRAGRRLRDAAPVEMALEPPREGPCPDALASRSSVLEAMRLISPIEREVVLQHDLEGRTHPEIAEALAISVVMSRQHLFRARHKLRTALDKTPR